MLNKPNHDLNFGITVKFNSRFQGNTVLNVNNSKEGVDLWKTHFNYKRVKLKLQADYFNITAFDNIGLVTFDDPLHIVGNIGYNDYDFGYGLSGIYAESSNLLSNNGFSILEVKTPGKLDAELVRKKAITKEIDLEGRPFLKRIMLSDWDTLGIPFQKFLEEYNS